MGWELPVAVDRQKFRVTLPDDWPGARVTQLAQALPGIVRKAQNRLGTAVTVTGQAPAALAGGRGRGDFLDLVRACFKLPPLPALPTPVPAEYLQAFNKLGVNLGKVLLGLCKDDIPLADVTEDIPVVVSAELAVGGAVKSAKEFVGDVWAKWTGEPPAPKPAPAHPLAGHAGWVYGGAMGWEAKLKTEMSGTIHLNFTTLLDLDEDFAALVLIHEASHKFALTTDESYLPDQRHPTDDYQTSVAAATAYRNIVNPTMPADQFEKMVFDGYADRFFNPDEKPKYKAMTADKGLINADSLAFYAIEMPNPPF